MPVFLERLKNGINYGALYLGNFSLLKLISPRPNYAEVRVTEGCNSRCVTCAAWKNSRVGELSTEEIMDAFRQLKEIGVKRIRLSGGEPLIRSDIGILVKECRLLGFEEVYVATNGLLLEQRAWELVENGVNHFGISLDGIKETNDAIRGVQGGFERVLSGVKAVKESAKSLGKNIPITIFTTILRQNICELQSILELCENIGTRWCFSLLDGNLDIFEGVDVSKFAVTDWAVIDKTVDYLVKLWCEKPWFVYSNPDILEYARKYLKGITCDNDIPCVLGYTLICLGSKGEVYPGCYVFDPVGNIRERKLKEIVKSKEYKKLAEKMYRRECPGCTFFYEDNILVRNMFPRLKKIRNLVKSR
jgi:MoaA/NifB/PqqE/SkfB family radical SAM enzyme